MFVRSFALVWGIAFLLLFAAGVVPGLLHAPAIGDPDIAMRSMYGRALGLFPVNVLHDGVHLVFGLWGLFAYRG